MTPSMSQREGTLRAAGTISDAVRYIEGLASERDAANSAIRKRNHRSELSSFRLKRASACPSS